MGTQEVELERAGEKSAVDGMYFLGQWMDVAKWHSDANWHFMTLQLGYLVILISERCIG